MVMLTRDMALGVKVRMVSPRMSHTDNTGRTESWSGELCVRVHWDDGNIDTFGYYISRFEVIQEANPW